MECRVSRLSIVPVREVDMVKAHVRRKDSFSVERPLALENPEQQMILSALDIIGKPVPTWLKLVFDAENRLLNRIDFP